MSQINAENITKLMDIFYGKIRHHQELGAIFNNAIGEGDEEWEAHKKRLEISGWGCYWVREIIVGVH